MQFKVSKTQLKIVVIIIVGILLVGVAFGAYVGGRVWTNVLPQNGEYCDVFARNYILPTNSDGEFNVLKINDTHFVNGRAENDVNTLDGIKRVLQTKRFDLVLLAGDVVEGFNLRVDYDKENALEKIAELLESFNVYWTFIPGNNDSEIDGDNRDVISYFLKYPRFIIGNERELDGDVNFFIDLSYNGEVKHTLALFDSGSRTPKITGKYDAIKESQVAWLKEEILRRNVPTSMFFHIPTPAFKEAYNKGMAVDGVPRLNLNEYDDVKGNSLFDNEMSTVENIKLLSVAHQHGNSMCSLNENRYYELSSPSGYSASRPDEAVISATGITISVNEASVENMYVFTKYNY